MFRVRNVVCAALALMVAFQATVPCCALAPRTERSELQCRCCVARSAASGRSDGSQKRSRTEQDRRAPSVPLSESECPFCAGTVHTREAKDDERTCSTQPDIPLPPANGTRPAVEGMRAAANQSPAARLGVWCDLLMLGRLLL